MVIFLYNLYIFVCIQHSYLANMIFLFVVCFCFIPASVLKELVVYYCYRYDLGLKIYIHDNI